VIADHTHFKGKSALLGISQGGVVAGIRKGHDQVDIGLYSLASCDRGVSGRDRHSPRKSGCRGGQNRISSKMNGLVFTSGKGMRLCSPASSMTMISPGFTSRRYLRHQIKRAGLRSDHPSPVNSPRQRGRILSDHGRRSPVACQHDQAVSTLDNAQGMNQGHFKTIFQMRRHKMNEDLAVHGGWKWNPGLPTPLATPGH